MSNPIVTPGSEEIGLVITPGREAAITVQGTTAGNTESTDFTWAIEKQLDGSGAWSRIKDPGGVSLFTGSGDFALLAAAKTKYRVTVTAMGTATKVFIGTN